MTAGDEKTVFIVRDETMIVLAVMYNFLETSVHVSREHLEEAWDDYRVINPSQLALNDCF